MKNIKCKHCAWVTPDELEGRTSGFERLRQHVAQEHKALFLKIARWLKDGDAPQN